MDPAALQKYVISLLDLESSNAPGYFGPQHLSVLLNRQLLRLYSGFISKLGSIFCISLKPRIKEKRRAYVNRLLNDLLIDSEQNASLSNNNFNVPLKTLPHTFERTGISAVVAFS